MRTTVTIDDDLLAEAKVLAARTHRTVSAVIEDGLRSVLEEPAKREQVVLPDFKHTGGLVEGVDLYDKEMMADILGDNDRVVL